MVNIFVSRHGQDADNANGILNGHRNEPLTDLGRQQAKDVAAKMLDGNTLLCPELCDKLMQATTLTIGFLRLL